ncbi:HD-GYP domain-containing protein [Azohydromonas sediminis]|uniref:HD-GYP domain-containing protein n=1 Tax=Azohydromonas sediminis TaxID=2259674 RepID=UPI000E64D75C|nr:HD domain-containing phosphohydrolase [Azohydromonas sediminis]
MTSPDPAHERVPIDQLRDLIQLGAMLPFRLLDAQGRLLLGEGQVVATERQFEQLHERGAWAERERVEAVRAANAAPAAAPPTLFHRWERLVWDLDATLQRLAGQLAAPHEVVDLWRRAQALLDRDPDVALFMAVRQDDRRFALYALTHSLHTASLAALAARQLGWDDARVQSLACAALTMNVAIVRLQAQLAEQRDPPNLRQREAIERHPLAGAQLLRTIGVADDEWLAAVEQHHEEPGGGGYPRKVAAPCEAAQLLRLADMLMAKLTPRAHRPAMAPRLATRDVFLADPDKRLSTAIVRVLGVYPPGSVVQLKTGETGVVTRRASGGQGPWVRVLAGGSVGRTVDTSAAADAIVQGVPMPAGVARVYPEQVYGLILVE